MHTDLWIVICNPVQACRKKIQSYSSAILILGFSFIQRPKNRFIQLILVEIYFICWCLQLCLVAKLRIKNAVMISSLRKEKTKMNTYLIFLNFRQLFILKKKLTSFNKKCKWQYNAIYWYHLRFFNNTTHITNRIFT